MLALPTAEVHTGAIIVCIVALVLLVRAAAAEIRRTGLFADRVVIVGTGRTASTLIEEIETRHESRYVVAGVVGRVIPKGRAMARRWLGAFEELADIVKRVRPARIVLALDSRRSLVPIRLLLPSRVRGVLVEDALDFYERMTGTLAIEALTPVSLLLSKGFRNRGAAHLVARGVSITVAAVGLVLSAPLLAAIAVAIKLDSPGPVLFVQARTGADGRPFGLLKFRTMHPTDEHHSEWVLDNQERVTRFGRVLRRFRADELPQLVNILRGEMNLIGPRPHPYCNHQMFEEHIAYYGLRSAVLPGVTGWAQVRYGYANTLEEETDKMRYDLYYIKNRSLWLDVRILIATVGIMILGDNGAISRHRGPRGHLISPRRSGAAGQLSLAAEERHAPPAIP